MLKKLVPLFISITICLSTAYAETADPEVKLITSHGEITLTLDRTRAPQTVKNFLAYVKSGYYNGTIFHRVIKGFMVQGGGLTEDMQRKPTRSPVQNEADNGLKNEPGTIAMARTQDPHSGTSQFFINTVDNQFLNHRGKSSQGWGYCVFGRVTDGLFVVHAIENTPTTVRAGRRDVPVTAVVIKKAVIVSE